MAKKKQSTRYAFGNHRYFAKCPSAKCPTKRYDSDDLADIPATCCGNTLTINDHATMMSRSKSELETR